MGDEVLWRTRVVTHEWQNAPYQIKHVATGLLALLREVQTGSVEASEAALDRLLVEVAKLESNLGRLEMLLRRCDEEAAHYRRLQAEIDASVGSTTSKLGELKGALAAARVERTQRQQYEQVAREINKRPPRDALAASIASVQEDLAAAVAERGALEARLATRRAQFHLVFSAIADLQRTFVEEADAERRKAAAGAAAAAIDALAAAGGAAAGAGGAGAAAEGEREVLAIPHSCWRVLHVLLTKRRLASTPPPSHAQAPTRRATPTGARARATQRPPRSRRRRRSRRRPRRAAPAATTAAATARRRRRLQRRRRQPWPAAGKGAARRRSLLPPAAVAVAATRRW